MDFIVGRTTGGGGKSRCPAYPAAYPKVPSRCTEVPHRYEYLLCLRNAGPGHQLVSDDITARCSVKREGWGIVVRTSGGLLQYTGVASILLVEMGNFQDKNFSFGLVLENDTEA